MLRIPDTANPFGQYEAPPGPSGLNVTILSPNNGSTVSTSVPWWTFGFGDKRFTAIVRVVNNTPFTKVGLQPSLTSGGVILAPNIASIADEVPSGTSKDFTFDVSVETNLTGIIPARLSISAIAGEDVIHLLGAVVASTSVDFVLSL